MRFPTRFSAAIFVIFLSTSLRALEPTEWQHRQTFTLERTGIVKFTVPPSTLDAARTGGDDLRLLDSDGHEVPYLLERPTVFESAVTRSPLSFRASLNDSVTQLVIETNTNSPLDAVELTTPAAGFIKAVTVEAMDADGAWKKLASGLPVFRQFGAEQLRVPLEGVITNRLRLSLDDSHTAPVPFTGAQLSLAAARPAETLPLSTKLIRREEFVGESVFTLDLGAAHVPLAALEFVTNEALFARRVTVGVRELHDEVPSERTLATGAIYRVAAEGLASSARLDVPLYVIAPARELLVHIANGDNPPIGLDEIRVRQRPLWLVFRATTTGTYALLSGHSQIAAPNYDLAALSLNLKAAPLTTLAISDPVPNPGYRKAETLADTPLRGADLDPAGWRFRKQVNVTESGVQQLELDPEVLAGSQSGLSDLRLIHSGTQVPYLLERTSLARALPITLSPRPDPAHPKISRWELKLARAGLPLTRLTLTASTALFSRELRVTEKFTGERGEIYDRTLAEGSWSKVPGDNRVWAISLYSPPQTDTLTLETDNGDNPAITLTAATGAYPVNRLFFKPDAGDLSLYYGNHRVSPPRYDLSLVAGQILSAEKSIAKLGPEQSLAGESPVAAKLHAGIWFWGALSLVVVALLLVVAKLLPKPPAPKNP